MSKKEVKRAIIGFNFLIEPSEKMLTIFLDHVISTQRRIISSLLILDNPGPILPFVIVIISL
jgi:hypothetical protein